MAIDKKYGAIITEKGNIGTDEPVVVFRAQDKLLPKLLKVYRYFCELGDCPEAHLELIDSTAATVKAWQAQHFHKMPD